MSDAKLLPAEAARSRTVAALSLVDMPASDEFDALAALAAHLLDCPIGLVTILDRDRQYVKAAHGTTLRDTGRNDAFCDKTIAQGGVLIVPDATADARFSGSALVTGGPALRAYAGIPISAREPGGVDRVPVGAVCAVDTVPRRFTPEQQALLAHLQTMAEALLDARDLQRGAELQAETLRRSDRVFRQAERLAEMGSWRLELDDESVIWSDGMYRIYDLPPGDAPPLQAAMDCFPERARATVAAAMAATIETGAPFELELDFTSSRGSRRRVRSLGELELRDGRAAALVGVFQDVSDRHAIEESLRRSASVDELTRIANRAAFNVELESAMERARADSTPLGLVLIDADHFKAINDTHGHNTGDDVLRAFGRRLRRHDPENSFAARVGGDEFALILTGPAATRIEAVVDSLLADLKAPVHGAAGVIPVSGTIGFARLRPQDGNVRDFVHRADTALYQAKRTARGTACGWGQLREKERRAG